MSFWAADDKFVLSSLKKQQPFVLHPDIWSIITSGFKYT